jgi:hypothetical protein
MDDDPSPPVSPHPPPSSFLDRRVAVTTGGGEVKDGIEGVTELMEVRSKVDELVRREDMGKELALDIVAAMADMERLVHRERAQRRVEAVEHKLEVGRLTSELDRLSRRHTRDSLYFQRIQDTVEGGDKSARLRGRT